MRSRSAQDGDDTNVAGSHEPGGSSSSETGAGPSARAFVVIPAVDVLGEEAVRLEQGDYARIGRRAGDPAGLVERFASAHPALIHVVDLGGAREGRIRPELIARLVEAAGAVPVQASGGIRSVEDALELLDAGAARVIVGTAAFTADAALERFVEAIGDRLVIAVDSRNGRLAISGWEREAGLTVVEAARRCRAVGVPRLHCTAVERDGTMRGPDLDLLAAVRDAAGLPILAAGGIRSQRDLERLAGLGLEGAVVGRALLEGTVPLSAISRLTARLGRDGPA
ncbi:MAG: 1-(5-phosphoribosyl)-5-[(5-phosphoribosylamino)methylideneamino] imidazole-4-carboxamide isomerase [Gaiellales bacterium]